LIPWRAPRGFNIPIFHANITAKVNYGKWSTGASNNPRHNKRNNVSYTSFIRDKDLLKIGEISRDLLTFLIDNNCPDHSLVGLNALQCFLDFRLEKHHKKTQNVNSLTQREFLRFRTK
jgi:hypothetical protein